MQKEILTMYASVLTEVLAKRFYDEAGKTRNAMKGLSQEATLDIMVGLTTGVAMMKHAVLECISKTAEMSLENPVFESEEDIEKLMQEVIDTKMALFATNVGEIRQKAIQMDLDGKL